MKELQKLIEEYEQEVAYIVDRKDNLINRGMIKAAKYHSGRKKQLLNVITDLKELLEKLKGASKRSSNVVENEQSKEYCRNVIHHTCKHFGVYGCEDCTIRNYKARQND